jgi:hypothetical protein
MGMEQCSGQTIIAKKNLEKKKRGENPALQ